jgi:flagellar protein FliO/FliZ
MKKYTIYFIILTIFFVFFMETQILANTVNIDNIKNYSSNESENLSDQNSLASTSAVSFLIYLMFFITISILAYLTTRWIGKHQMRLTIKSKYMEVIDSLSLGGEKSLYIVRSPQGLLMLGVTKESLHLLEKLGAEEAELIRQAEANHESYDKTFAVSLYNYLNKIKGSSEQNKYGGQNENK